MQYFQCWEQEEQDKCGQFGVFKAGQEQLALQCFKREYILWMVIQDGLPKT